MEEIGPGERQAEEGDRRSFLAPLDHAFAAQGIAVKWPARLAPGPQTAWFLQAYQTSGTPTYEPVHLQSRVGGGWTELGITIRVYTNCGDSLRS